MTTYTPFTPTPQAPFQFRPTLDGQVYSAIIKWNVAGQRWYLQLYSGQNALILATALIPSPLDRDFNLVEMYFQVSSLVFREATQQFEVTP